MFWPSALMLTAGLAALAFTPVSGMLTQAWTRLSREIGIERIAGIVNEPSALAGAFLVLLTALGTLTLHWFRRRAGRPSSLTSRGTGSASIGTELPPLAGLFRRLWLQLEPRRRRQLLLLLTLMLVNIGAELFSLGAVLPFIGVLTAPEKVFRHPVVHEFAADWGIQSGQELMLPLTILFGLLTLTASASRLILLWAHTRLTFAVGSDLSVEAYRRTLYQPYSVHAATNSSTIIAVVGGKIDGVIFGVVYNALILVSSSVLLIAIATALLTIDAQVALIAALVLGTIYTAVTRLTRAQLRKNSATEARALEAAQKALQEGLGGIRDVLLDGTQPIYSGIFREADWRLRRAQGSNMFIAWSPRYLLEAIGMILIAGLAYGLSQRSGGIAEALPLLGALTMGAQRLLPAMQQVYQSWAGINGNWAALADTLDLLERPLSEEAAGESTDSLDFERDLVFQDICYRYQDQGPSVLEHVNLTVPKGARIGIVGGTGSGKSTLFDVLMGLLEPTRGRILVDGHPITGTNRRAWQRTLAHVPQSIYLADTTIAENIAFGIPRSEIDMDRVRRSARRAQIADYIESRPEGYDAFVGERGIRLSGGQRQRIGIARALYKQAKVFIFDEATSALDNTTEQALMEAIDAIDRDITILTVAHRLTTVRRCDTIIELEGGRVVAQGTYDQLLEHSPTFRSMAATGRT